MTVPPPDPKTLLPGAIVFREGDPGSVMYLIQSGTVEIYKIDALGNERILGVCGKGEIFGEMALVDQAPRMASARTLEKTVVTVIPQHHFTEQIARAHPMVKALLTIFVRMIRHLSEQVTDLQVMVDRLKEAQKK